MIFSRRSIQRRLDALRCVLDDSAVERLVQRLNLPGRDRLAAMWEVVVFFALSRRGRVRSEIPLASGRRPDIHFSSKTLAFVADVTTVSDDALEDQNPQYEFSALIEAAKRRLGLPTGGTDLRVHSREEHSRRGTRITLRLPPRKQLQQFVRSQIEPQLREQMLAGEKMLRVSFSDDISGFDLTIDPLKSPYNTGSYTPYTFPTIKDKNPLYNVLKMKADQIRAYNGIKGVIACDVGSDSLVDHSMDHRAISSHEIVRRFLRNHTSINFVLLLSIGQVKRGRTAQEQVTRRPLVRFAIGKEFKQEAVLETLFRSMMIDFPDAVMSAWNGASQACEAGFGWGYQGGYQLSQNHIVISSRALMELLAGRRDFAETSSLHGWEVNGHASKRSSDANPFERFLRQGRLPTSIKVLKTGESECDDWVEFEFGEIDPAITLFH